VLKHKKGIIMDSLQLESFFEEIEVVSNRSSRSKAQKRKWREIEAIKDKQRLRQELTDLDVCREYELEEIEL
jgi:hypothetical protein